MFIVHATEATLEIRRKQSQNKSDNDGELREKSAVILIGI